jgi:hypothetical protein
MNYLEKFELTFTNFFSMASQAILQATKMKRSSFQLFFEVFLEKKEKFSIFSNELFTLSVLNSCHVSALHNFNKVNLRNNYTVKKTATGQSEVGNSLEAKGVNFTAYPLR